ncbi:Hypothetical protein CINCED_3A011505 [Cinara cedri]|uniref:Gustatory receptor n=1 Tax=Cinara cedri TaxID=506608 RepID=A0A5E4MH07_9HEMI|nr:Hypothetical protein CINCED_3A011505 [Cinara cedri]
MPVNVFYLFTASAANSKVGIAWCLVLAFNNLACFSTDMQFIRCAGMLRYRFNIINNELETIATVWQFKRGALVEKKTCRSFLSELSYGHKLCDSIEMYRYCYGQFCNMLCQLNSTYQLHLLGSISACFLKVLFNLYFSMFGCVVGTNDQKEQDELTRAICWFIFYGMRFLTIIYVANATSKQIILSVVIIVTCAFNLVYAHAVAYKIDDWSDAMSTSLTVFQCSVVAVLSLVSRSIVLYNIVQRADKYRKYKTTLKSFDIYSPMTAVVLNQCRSFSLAVFALSALIILPINAIKLYNLYNRHPDKIFVTTYFFFFYAQNLSMCFIENHFVDECFVIYRQFREVNGGLKNIKCELCVDYSRFSVVKETTSSVSNVPSPRAIVYDKDFYNSKDKEHPLANIVELLKIRHWLIREAVFDLNNLFGIHLGLSLISLGVLSLFDIYTEVFHYFTNTKLDSTMFRSKLLFLGWIAQYSFRLCVITITSHITTKQADYAKTLITDINNRYLDSSTKEELQLFYSQISSRSTEFTACDLFTLNTRLITSAIAAGATYLVILVQFHSNKN